MDVPAAHQNFDFLYNPFSSQFTSMDQHAKFIIKKKHPILLKFGAFYDVICLKYTQFM